MDDNVSIFTMNKDDLGYVPKIIVQPKEIIGHKAAVSDYNYRKFIEGDDTMPEAAPARENETVGTFNKKTYKDG